MKMRRMIVSRNILNLIINGSERFHMKKHDFKIDIKGLMAIYVLVLMLIGFQMGLYWLFSKIIFIPILYRVVLSITFVIAYTLYLILGHLEK